MAYSHAVYIQTKLVFISVKPAEVEEFDKRKWFAAGCGMTYGRDKVTGEWRRLHNEELNDLYWGVEEIA